MEYVLGIALIVSIASNVFIIYILTHAHQEEKKALHDRLMSRDYPEYKQGQDYDLSLQQKKAEIEHASRQRMKTEKITKEDQHRKNLAAKL